MADLAAPAQGKADRGKARRALAPGLLIAEFNVETANIYFHPLGAGPLFWCGFEPIMMG
jgi:hypothetical protein